MSGESLLSSNPAQGEPADPVLALQKKFTLEPVSGNARSPELPPLPATAGNDLGFYKQLAFVLKSNAVKPADEALFAQFARIGLTQWPSCAAREPSTKG
jgi:hypothetical protein